MNEQELDQLINDQFASAEVDDQSSQDFDRLWAQAQRQVSTPRRWPTYAAAAALVVTVLGGLVVMEQGMGTRHGPIVAFAVQDEVLTTTLWHAPSDQFLNQTPTLAGWQLPGREPLQLKEVL